MYLLKCNDGNTRTMFQICLKLTVKTAEGERRPFGVFIVSFEQISHIAQAFPLLALNT